MSTNQRVTRRSGEAALSEAIEASRMLLAEGGRHAVTRVRVVETFGTPPAAALAPARTRSRDAESGPALPRPPAPQALQNRHRRPPPSIVTTWRIDAGAAPAPAAQRAEAAGAPMTRVPLMPAFVRGVINLRGAVLPVIAGSFSGGRDLGESDLRVTLSRGDLGPLQSGRAPENSLRSRKDRTA
mgnify:CR=1 FL=1